MGHIAGLAFGGLQPHSPSEHVQDPNVLIIHSVKVLTNTTVENIVCVEGVLSMILRVWMYFICIRDVLCAAFASLPITRLMLTSMGMVPLTMYIV